MSYNDFLNLKVGDKILNIKGKRFKVLFKRNKDKFGYGVHVYTNYIHKNNYQEFRIIV